jgi:NADP-dependent 3-hydroxy acid dehydrogenase YdfG
MSSNFEGKVIAITGGTSGIGLAAAKMLASRGATLALCGRREDTLNAVVEEIKASTGTTVIGTCTGPHSPLPYTKWLK